MQGSVDAAAHSLRVTDVGSGSRTVVETRLRRLEDTSLPPYKAGGVTPERHSHCGRVEDGRGSLGPLANAPFPIPAHRTGRAELPHPALRLASPKAHSGAGRGRRSRHSTSRFRWISSNVNQRVPRPATLCRLARKPRTRSRM